MCAATVGTPISVSAINNAVESGPPETATSSGPRMPLASRKRRTASSIINQGYTFNDAAAPRLHHPGGADRRGDHRHHCRDRDRELSQCGAEGAAETHDGRYAQHRCGMGIARSGYEVV